MREESFVGNEKQSIQVESEGIREKRIMNTVVNTSIILMGVLMGGFGEFMANTVGSMASGMVEAVSGEEEAKKVQKEMQQKLPEVTDKMMAMMADMRNDIYSQMMQKRKEIEPFLSDPVFDVGPKKIDEYDFGLPKLSEELDDEALAQYSYLLVSEDATFGKLFGELTDWMNSLPSFPKKSDGK